MKKVIVKLVLLMILNAGLHTVLYAQGPGDPDGEPDPEVPLDPGSWVLVAAGVGYGVKKWRDSKHKPSENGGNETADFIEK